MSNNSRYTLVSAILVTALVVATAFMFKKIKNMKAEQRGEIIQMAKSLPISSKKIYQQLATSAGNRLENDASVKKSNSESSEISQKNRVDDKKINYRGIIDQFKDRPLVNACDLIDGKDDRSKNLQENLRSSEFNLKVYNQGVKVDSLLATNFFQISLPVNNLIIDLLNEEGAGLLHDLRYVRLIYQAKAELEKNLDAAKTIQLRSYYSYILKKIIFKHPELIGDAAAITICSKLQNLEEDLSQQDMNLMISDYLERAQVNPSDVQFNPEYVPEVKIIWSDIGFAYQAYSKF